MKNKASRKNHLLQELRQKAESRINNLKTGEDIDFTSIHEVIHELNVHQVELTMQKDELEAKQRDLEKSRNEYFRLFDLAPVGYFVFDEKGIIIDVNNFGSKILHQTQDKLINKPFMLFLDTNYQKTFIDHRKKTLQSRKPQNTLLKLKSRSNQEILVKVTSIAFEHNQGEPLRCFSVMEDITELQQSLEAQKQLNTELEQINTQLRQEVKKRKEIETELIQHRDAAQSATRAKSEFLANMSHELRTPLNGIMGTIQVLETSDIDSDLMEMVEMAKTSGTGILKILNDILEFSSTHQESFTIKNKFFELRKAVSHVFDAFQSVINQKSLHHTIEIDPDIPAYICGDEARLRQVIFNLLGNSVKFTENGNINLKVNLAASDDLHITLKFSIFDTGVGIPQDLIKQVFEPFTQVDGSYTRKYGGIGMGLSLSSNLIKLMGGDIDIQSKPQKGTVVDFTLSFLKNCPQEEESEA